MICSDGLTDMVSESEIKKTLEEVQDVKRCVKCLIQKALEYGGRDNITVIVIDVDEGKKDKNISAGKIQRFLAILTIMLMVSIFGMLIFMKSINEKEKIDVTEVVSEETVITTE